MGSTWIALAFELLIAGGVVALAVRELILLRRDRRRLEQTGRDADRED